MVLYHQSGKPLLISGGAFFMTDIQCADWGYKWFVLSSHQQDELKTQRMIR